ncbi:MAG: hypothetical protein WAL50_17740 [Kineosporiaceae bacterium]|jgi:pimeloyl-ACP methyl ester carboxylesterase
MDILLIAGLWLDGSAWDAVVPALEARGHRPVAIRLPGQGDGAASATLEFLPIEDGVMRLPGWGPFEGPDSADLDEQTKARIAAAAIPVPAGVTSGVVRLRDERRFDVPAVLVCPEFPPAQTQEWIATGDLSELARATDLELVDLDSDHWPMVSRPAELAALLADLAERSVATEV